jgi:hypothetical protein
MVVSGVVKTVDASWPTCILCMKDLTDASFSQQRLNLKPSTVTDKRGVRHAAPPAALITLP